MIDNNNGNIDCYCVLLVVLLLCLFRLGEWLDNIKVGRLG